MQTRNTKKTTSSTRQPRLEAKANAKLPFIEHFYELRRRLFYVAVSVAVGSAVAYGVQMHIVNILLRPAQGQNFIYTSPGGGIDFLFRLCIYTGIILSIPVIVYNVLRFFEPLVERNSIRAITYGSFISAILAGVGIAMGYFAGLPAALHFLLNQFNNSHIQPLVTIQSYMSFVMVYMLGSAMIFQLPLIIFFINRIKPLNPKSLFKYERWVILVSFIAAGIMSPTPSVQDQLFLAVPMVLMYQVSIALVAFTNRPKRAKRIRKLLELDEAARAERQAKLSSLQPLLQQTSPVFATSVSASATAKSSLQPSPGDKTLTHVVKPAYDAKTPHQGTHSRQAATSARPRKYLDGFIDIRPSNTASSPLSEFSN